MSICQAQILIYFVIFELDLLTLGDSGGIITLTEDL